MASAIADTMSMAMIARSKPRTETLSRSHVPSGIEASTGMQASSVAVTRPDSSPLATRTTSWVSAGQHEQRGDREDVGAAGEAVAVDPRSDDRSRRCRSHPGRSRRSARRARPAAGSFRCGAQVGMGEEQHDVADDRDDHGDHERRLGNVDEQQRSGDGADDPGDRRAPGGRGSRASCVAPWRRGWC